MPQHAWTSACQQLKQIEKHMVWMVPPWSVRMEVLTSRVRCALPKSALNTMPDGTSWEPVTPSCILLLGQPWVGLRAGALAVCVPQARQKVEDAQAPLQAVKKTGFRVQQLCSSRKAAYEEQLRIHSKICCDKFNLAMSRRGHRVSLLHRHAHARTQHTPAATSWLLCEATRLCMHACIYSTPVTATMPGCATRLSGYPAQHTPSSTPSCHVAHCRATCTSTPRLAHWSCRCR
jgi:hypothetical protein